MRLIQLLLCISAVTIIPPMVCNSSTTQATAGEPQSSDDLQQDERIYRPYSSPPAVEEEIYEEISKQHTQTLKRNAIE